MIIRASSLPMVLNCHASFQEARKSPSMTSEESRLGTAIHALAELGPAPSEERVEGVLLAHNLEAEERARALELWEALPPIPQDAFREHHVTVQLKEGLHVSCTLDAMHSDGKTARIWDYKTGLGFVPSPPENAQMWAYAMAAAVEFGWEMEAVEVVIPQPAKGREGRPYRFGLADLDAFQVALIALAEAALAERPNYTTGSHCSRCNGRFTCPALLVEIRPVAELETVDLGAEIASLTDATVGQLAWRAGMLAGLAERAKDACNAELRKRGVVSVNLPNGQVWGQAERTKNDIDTIKAWPILSARLGDAMPNAIKVQKAGIEEAAGKVAERGLKAALVRSIMDELDVAGALKKSVSNYYRATKVAEEKKSDE